MPQAKSKVFRVRPKAEALDKPDMRLIRAQRESQVRAFLSAEYEVVPATQDDCIQATKVGIEVEQIGEQGE